MSNYKRLCTEYYNLSKPWVQPTELNFYLTHLAPVTTPILEGMCGSGRVLIPLQENGLNIEGVDSSEEMLSSCKQRCLDKKLSPPTLYHQFLQELRLPKKYGCIYIPNGSIQLIPNREDTLQALIKIHEHLLNDGFLLLETFVPWGLIKECIHGQQITGSHVNAFNKKALSPQGYEVHYSGLETTRPKAQKTTIEGRYTKIADNHVMEAEEETYHILWYYPFEMELLLEKAGFQSITVFEVPFEANLNALVYRAIK